MNETLARPDPDQLLARINHENSIQKNPTLKIFLGMAAGVGKTYAMLQEARTARAQGADIVLGIIETHARPDTVELLGGLEILPRRSVNYKGIILEELDIEAVIARHPEVIVIDELAHENAPGSRHIKRWQDIEELLEKGISVWTAVNIQHLESYSDVVEDLTLVQINERVPDTFFDRAEEIRLIDITPEDLVKRLEEGRVYTGDMSRLALENFFTLMNLGALREIALRYTMRSASRKLTTYARADSAGSTGSSSNERILVAVGSAPTSAYLIRWTRRTAYALRADWIAVHVDTGMPMNAAGKKTLEENMRLARTLGAEIIETRGDDLVSTIVNVAKTKTVSLIVVGRSGLSRSGFFLRRPTISDRIMREAAPIDVALVQDAHTAVKPQPFDSLKHAFSVPKRQYALLAFAFVALILLGKLLSPSLGYRGLALIFLAVILVLSTITKPAPVALLTFLSALALDYFFIPPFYTFSIGRAEDWILFGVYFLVAFVTSSLVSRVRSRERLLNVREKEAAFLADVSRTIPEAHTEQEAVAIAISIIEKYFETNAFIFTDKGEGRLARSPLYPTSYELSDREFEAACYAYVEQTVCGAGTETLPFAAFRYIPIFAGKISLGVMGVPIQKNNVWTQADDNLLLSLGRTLTLMVERQRSETRQHEVSLKLESERLANILLDSVSHELRTPLTAITGSLSALNNDSIAQRQEARQALVANALDQAEALDDVVEDLLSLSRIESGMVRLKREGVDLPDLASAAIKRAGAELKARQVKTEIAEGSVPVMVDETLVIRLAANLLRNAARYSPEHSEITFALNPGATALRLLVRDCGPGLPGDELATIFDKFSRGRNAKGKGLGLGLAICRGIAEAHGGSISARNVPGGGLEVEAILPYSTEGSP